MKRAFEFDSLFGKEEKWRRKKEEKSSCRVKERDSCLPLGISLLSYARILSLSLSLFYFFLFHFLSIRMNRLISLFIINYNPNYTSPTKLLEHSIWCILQASISKGKNIISWHALQTILQSSVSSFKGSIFIQISRLKDSSSIC